MESVPPVLSQETSTLRTTRPSGKKRRVLRIFRYVLRKSFVLCRNPLYVYFPQETSSISEIKGTGVTICKELQSPGKGQ